MVLHRAQGGKGRAERGVGQAFDGAGDAAAGFLSQDVEKARIAMVGHICLTLTRRKVRVASFALKNQLIRLVDDGSMSCQSNRYERSSLDE